MGEKHGIFALNGLKILFQKIPEVLDEKLVFTLLKECIRDFPQSQAKDEDLYEFIEKRLTPQISKYFIDALCRGIYATSAKNISKSVFFSSQSEENLKSIALNAA